MLRHLYILPHWHSISPNHTILTQGQPAQTLTPWCQTPGRAATRVPIWSQWCTAAGIGQSEVMLGSLSCRMRRCRFNPLSLQQKGFSLGVNMVPDSIPYKTLSDESINWGLVCANLHSIAQTQKIPTFISLTGECQQQNTQHAPSTKMECDYPYGWVKNSHYVQISPKQTKKKVKARDIGGKAEEEWWRPEI